MIASTALVETIFPSCPRKFMKGNRIMRTSASSKECMMSIKKKCINHVRCNAQETFFTKKSPSITDDHCGLENLVKSIKNTMAKKTNQNDNVEELVMIDVIERLGLGYYFHEEIHVALAKHYVSYTNFMEDCDSLHDAALRFRLLRQEGYYVSADSLGTFKDKDGKFKEQLANDIKGLISLFEASKLSIPSDIILEDAKEFSGKFLKASLEHIEHYEAKLIVNTLRYPYYQSLPRLTAKKFLPNCTTFLKFCHGANSMNGWVDEVQDLARIDMNMAHFTNQDEITHVSRWWKKLKLAEESKVARHKPVIWHMWSMALLPNPDMAEQRIELTKPISLIYIIDDLFDTCATTLEDLIVFTEAITKWECTYVEGLPDYMNLCLKTLHDITNETCYKIYQRYGWDPKDSLKTAWADLCKAFLVEARWFASGYLPTTEEYVKNGIVSSGVAIMSIYVFSILGENLYDTTADLFAINNYPEIVSSTAIIFRLWNGLGGAKDENQEAYDGSFIACYMNEYKGSSHESAEQHALGMISDTWKCLNKACLSNSPFSADFKAACLNMARMIPVMYNYDFTY